MNRFKEFRRQTKPRKLPNDERVTPSRAGKYPGITKRPVPPPGEDSVSYERHTKALQMEFKKTNRNVTLIDDLMVRSFPFRQAEIEEKSYDCKMLFCRFLFLQEGEQVCIHHPLVIQQ